MLFHRGAYHQRGRGLGSMFAGLARTVFPILKSLGKSIISSPTTKEILKSAKKSAINAGLDLAADTLSGKNIKQSVKHRGSEAVKRVGNTVSQQIKRKREPTQRQPKKQKREKKSRVVKKRRKFEDVFEEYDSE
jgi:hypothetical protein